MKINSLRQIQIKHVFTVEHSRPHRLVVCPFFPWMFMECHHWPGVHRLPEAPDPGQEWTRMQARVPYPEGGAREGEGRCLGLVTAEQQQGQGASSVERKGRRPRSRGDAGGEGPGDRGAQGADRAHGGDGGT